MSTKTHVSKIFTAVLSVVILLPAIVFFFMYVSIGWQNKDINDVDKMDTFTGYFAGFLKNINVIHGISILCCIAAIAFASRSFRKRSLPLRLVTLFVVLAAIFILFFDFSQMI
jgi:hypothetical protein